MSKPASWPIPSCSPLLIFFFGSKLVLSLSLPLPELGSAKPLLRRAFAKQREKKDHAPPHFFVESSGQLLLLRWVCVEVVQRIRVGEHPVMNLLEEVPGLVRSRHVLEESVLELLELSILAHMAGKVEEVSRCLWLGALQEELAILHIRSRALVVIPTRHVLG
eukprot:758235-Hanusia_phi.AAC.6